MRSPPTATAPSRMTRRSGSIAITVPSMSKSMGSDMAGSFLGDGSGWDQRVLLDDGSRYDAAGVDDEPRLGRRGDGLAQRRRADGQQLGGRTGLEPHGLETHHRARGVAHELVGVVGVELR